MNRRSLRIVMIVVVVAAVVWLGGQALWHAIEVMHGAGR
jgi:lipopolysaccharide export system protein LptC